MRTTGFTAAAVLRQRRRDAELEAATQRLAADRAEVSAAERAVVRLGHERRHRVPISGRAWRAFRSGALGAPLRRAHASTRR